MHNLFFKVSFTKLITMALRFGGSYNHIKPKETEEEHMPE